MGSSSAAGAVGERRFDFRWQANLKKRLHGECVLLRFWMWKMFLSLFITCYLCTVLFRNMAFARHRQISAYVTPNSTVIKHRLMDLGFQMTPDLSPYEWVSVLNERVQLIVPLTLLITAMIPAVCPRICLSRPYFFHVAFRFFFAITTCHLLRPMFYLSTSLPGPGEHCIGEEEELNHPSWSASDILLSHGVGKNCGDLMFSGHMLMVVTCTWTQHRYIGELFGPKAGKWGLFGFSFLVLIQIFIIISTRHHFTVDVVAGCFMATFNWMCHEKYFRPNDPSPLSREVRAAALKATSWFGPLPPLSEDEEEGLHLPTPERADQPTAL